MLNIKQRQRNFNFLNYATGGIDGLEGSKTKSAYRAFQRDFGLNVDGIYGPKTDAKLVSVIKEIQTAIGTTADGVAGNNTKQKCKEYQANHGLAEDGICGIATRNSIYSKNLSWDNFKHFKQSEFTCKCGCGLNNINLNLVNVLEKIRDHFGGHAVHITSGCRCTKHNKDVGGVQGSRHVIGKASDIYIDNVLTSDLLNYCQHLVQEGTLRYTYTNNKNMNGVVHIDIQ